jgi:hypothetical protein
VSKIARLSPDQMLQQLFAGVAPPTAIAGSGTPAYGTQQNPLDTFANAQGLSGNKTTNKDLPDWLKAIGMKGDAYAGGMLKPELRYGFAYKGGKIHFADGTSFAAKKVKGKDGKVSYSYTGADGKATSYDPTDEQNAYNKKYKASTSNQSVLDKATNAVKFELDHGIQIHKGVWDHPQQAIFGIDPLGTKIGNAVTGDNATAQVDQLGGALPGRYADYEQRTGNATGYAKPLQGIAHTVAAIYGGKGLSNVGGNLAARAGSGSTGEGLGVFSNGGKAGMSGVGGGSAGTLGTSGGIAGGAGAGSAAAGSSSNGILGSLFGNGTNGMASGSDWINTLLNLYGTYQSSQGASQQRSDLAGAANRLSTNLGGSSIAGPGGLTADLAPNGAGGKYGLGDLEDPRSFLTQLGTLGSKNALNNTGLPDNIMQALQGLSSSAGVPGMPNNTALDSGVGSAFGQSLAGLTGTGVGQDVQNTAFSGANSQLADASRGFGDVRDSTLATLRAQAQPEETRAYDTLQNDLFSTGRSGSSGGALQTEAFARGLGQADLSRQLAANQEARTTQQNALGLGTGLAGVGSNIAGLNSDLLSSAFSRFGQTAGLAQGLDQQRFGNSVLLNQTGYDRAQNNFQNQVSAAQLPTSLQGQQLQLALQALGGQSDLNNQGLQGLQLALQQASAQANARTGNSSAIASLLGTRAQSPNGGDIWGQLATGIASRNGDGNGSLGNILSGLFGGNKTTQPVYNDTGGGWN